MFVHDVTIIRCGTTTNRYGDVERDWTTATETTTRGWLSQSAQSENLQGRDALIRIAELFLPAGTDINGWDRVVYDGITYELAGPPHNAVSPRLGGGVHHIECQLSAVEG